ncbi:MAG: glutamate-5-semialdehyde dehydrogenase [Opitutaceae bacterium]|jgi:glutamate-5-semialdehyde dehydrogenase|nr:glutamate-5-semialdehyde dehydrogenase [Opitutaceae bacterium]
MSTTADNTKVPSLAATVTRIARRARAASLVLANAPAAQKNAALLDLARRLEAPENTGAILAANALDLAAARDNALTPAQIDRLTLNPERLAHLAESVRQVAALPDPVGDVLSETARPNGLVIRKIRVPIGVIAIIYEARPNVTVDCAVLCLKSGNASILRGGREIFNTNTALAKLIAGALAAAGLPADAAQLIPTTDRAALKTLLKLNSLVHCVIPRGGESLIRFVAKTSTIPVIKHYNGVCFLFVDRDADPALAEKILVNAKTQRTGVCNALEQLLVDAPAAQKLLPGLARALLAKNVTLHAAGQAAAILRENSLPFTPARKADNTAEYLSLDLNIRVVAGLDEAVAVINRDGSGHSDAIVTSNADTAARFLAGVDSACVFWNASTRFSDGFEFGFGAEIGISTDRLHARGPMGLPELCTYKYQILGDGQTRG